MTSMQSICLEGLGGENVVDPRLQETTFIQHTFGGRLKSKVFLTSMHLTILVKLCHEMYCHSVSLFSSLTILLCHPHCKQVKCLSCHHESERYENIMDLTLEIFGWVQSLEDALTQFTTPEDLDGENKYRCGRLLTLYMLESNSVLISFCRFYTLQVKLKWVTLNVLKVRWIC